MCGIFFKGIRILTRKFLGVHTREEAETPPGRPTTARGDGPHDRRQPRGRGASWETFSTQKFVSSFPLQSRFQAKPKPQVPALQQAPLQKLLHFSACTTFPGRWRSHLSTSKKQPRVCRLLGHLWHTDCHDNTEDAIPLSAPRRKRLVLPAGTQGQVLLRYPNLDPH